MSKRKPVPTEKDMTTDVAKLKELEDSEDPQLPAIEGPPDRLGDALRQQELDEKARQAGKLFENRGPIHQAVDDAAQAYNECKIERSELSKREKELKDALYTKMKNHKLERYETKDGWVVQITVNEKVRTKRKEDDEGNGINPDGNEVEDDIYDEEP